MEMLSTTHSPRPARRALRLALGVWLVLACAVSVRALLRPESHTVFPIFVAAADRYWADRPLYDKLPGLDYFRYPPTFVLVATPLSWFGTRVGGALWAWASCAVLVAGLWRFARRVLPEDLGEARTGALLALGALGALRGLWNGQSNALVVGLLLLGAAEVVRERWWRASFLLSAAVWIKLTPLAPALLLCALWPRRLAPRFACALVALPLVPFLTRPPSLVLAHYAGWLGHLTASSGERWPGFRDAWTIWEVARHTFAASEGPLILDTSFNSPVYRTLQLTTAGAVLLWCLHLRRRCADRRWQVNATLALGSAWLMLFGPASEHATYVFLAPALAWAVLDPQAGPPGALLARSAFVLVMVLGWGNVTRPLLGALPLLVATLPLGTGVFVVWLIGHAQAQRARQALPCPTRRVRAAVPLPERARSASTPPHSLAGRC